MNESLCSIQYLGGEPVYIEGFPSECVRSVKGSLHLYPRKVTTITSDELNFLKNKRMDVFRFVRTVSMPAQKSVPLEKKEELPVVEANKESDRKMDYQKKWKKKGSDDQEG